VGTKISICNGGALDAVLFRERGVRRRPRRPRIPSSISAVRRGVAVHNGIPRLLKRL
jgi:hypothetical protein